MVYTRLTNAESNGTIVLGINSQNLSQISAFFIPRFLPNLNVGLSLAIFSSTDASAAEWVLGGTDYYAGNPGMSCYSDYSNYVVYACECDANVVDNYKLLCPGNDTCGTRVDGNGNEEYVCDVLECKLEGAPVEGYTRYCFPDNAPDACTACGCKSKNTTNVSWTFIGSGRVTRTITSVSSSGYTCSQSKTAEFGCAAGYYRSAGSGSTMTCTACPSGGTSVAGNSSGIGACYKPAGSSFTDTKGTYTCSGAAYYK